MKSQFILFLVFLIVSLVVGNPPSEVKAQEIHYALDLSCDEPFYWKGDTIQINVTSNSSVQVTLSLYWNWKTYSENELIYQNTKTANATWDLPTSNQKVGFYRIVANTSDRTITTWRTLIHRTDYVSASLPFSYVWDKINYTFQGRTLKAETARDYLEIKYPKIPFQHRTRFFRNNMSFVIRLDNETQGWKVDTAYFLMCGCLKWFVNGTLNSPKTFDFKLSHNPLTMWKKQLDSMRGKGLVFDWSDIRKMKQAFTWNSTTKTLHVTIPETFFIDPTLFEDGFEGQDVPPWTGTVIDGDHTLDLNNTESAHHGSESCKIIRPTPNMQGHTSVYRTGFGANHTIFMRWYVNITEADLDGAANRYFSLGGFSDGNWRGLGVLQISDIGNDGDLDLELSYRNVSAYVTDEQIALLSYDTWTCLELKRIEGGLGTGEYRVWVDGVSIHNVTNVDTDNFGHDRIRIGGEGHADGDSNATWYSDCVVVDVNYIGVEAEGEEVTHELTETFNITDNTITRRSRTITETETITITSIRTVGTERLFTYSELIQINEVNTRGISRFLTTLEIFTINDYVSVSIGAIGIFYANLGTFSILDNLNLRISRFQTISENIIINDNLSIGVALLVVTVEAFESLNILSTLNIIVPTIYNLNDAIMLGAIAFIIAICGVVIAITKRD